MVHRIRQRPTPPKVIGLRYQDPDLIRSIRHELHGPLVRLLDRYGRPRRAAVTTAISEAFAAVVENTELDDADLGAIALAGSMRRVRLPVWDDHAGQRWLQLSPGERMSVALTEVEQLTLSQMAKLLPVDAETLQACRARGRDALGLDHLGSVACPGWANVTRLHQTRGDDAMTAFEHLETCEECAAWHAEREARREMLSELAPAVGATGMGLILSPVEGVGVARNVGYGQQLAGKRVRSKSTLWN